MRCRLLICDTWNATLGKIVRTHPLNRGRTGRKKLIRMRGEQKHLAGVIWKREQVSRVGDEGDWLYLALLALAEIGRGGDVDGSCHRWSAGDG